MTEQPEREVVRWFTRGRRIPQYIWTTPDGFKLPGGPYTFHQIGAAAGIFVVGYTTRDIWGFLEPSWVNLAALIGFAAAVVIGMGMLPVGGRSPIAFATGALRAVFSPKWGTRAGTQVRAGKKHRVVGQPKIDPRPLPTNQPIALVPAQSRPKPAPKPAPRPTMRPVALANLARKGAQL